MNAQTRSQVASAVQACEDKKGEDISILEMDKNSSAFTDYFVICEGTSERQIRAIAEGVDEELARHGVEPYRREGRPADGWVLLDYSDVVVHLFAPELRAYYNLEKLWERGRTVARLV